MSIKKAIYSFITIFLLFFLVILLKSTFNDLIFLRESHETQAQTLNSEEKKILEALTSEPLSFLGMGSQCFALSSKNSPYVLKICKASRYQIPFFMENRIFASLASDYVTNQKNKKIKKRKADFFSYDTAKNNLKDQSGVLFTHLSKTKNINKKLTATSPLGLSCSFELDDLTFYVQEKAVPLQDHLLILLQENKTKEIQLIFYELFQIILGNCKKGLQVQDTCPRKNIGIVKGKPMWIDPGRIITNLSLVYPENQKKTLENFQQNSTFFLSSLSNELEPLSQAALTQILTEI